jgi:hypothetical protein
VWTAESSAEPAERQDFDAALATLRKVTVAAQSASGADQTKFTERLSPPQLFGVMRNMHRATTKSHRQLLRALVAADPQHLQRSRGLAIHRKLPGRT